MDVTPVRSARSHPAPRVSPSVADLISRWRDKPVSASRLAADLLVNHPGYGTGRAEAFGRILLEIDEGSSVKEGRDSDAWLERIVALYAGDARIAGRCVVLGLALLDRTVFERLSTGGFLAGLSEERQDGPSAADRLRPEWREALLERLGSGGGTAPLDGGHSSHPGSRGDPRGRRAILGLVRARVERLRAGDDGEVSGGTETFSDSPTRSDLLGRRAFADVLAARIERLRANERDSPIVIHLDGPWGSGKSTVLNLLEDALRHSAPTEDRGWMVVSYNAWQQQRFESPWWILTERLASQGATDLDRRGRRLDGLRLRLRHYYFRTLSGRIWVVIAGLLAVGAGAALYRLGSLGDAPGGGLAKTIASSAKDLLSVAATVFGLAVAASRFLMATDTTAQDYLKSRPDPLAELTCHLGKVFKDLDRKVAIFVDDIDRCDAGAVVKTLEGIHVVFTAIPVVFVVAGDGRWIERAFEKTYGDVAPAAARSAIGQTLGGLFIEKLFQISAAVPQMPASMKEAFWNQLLGVRKAASKPPGGGRPSEISGLKSEEEILDAVAAVDVTLDPKRARKVREEAMRRLVAPDLIERPTRHVLEVLRDSVEANPRAMKRHVMAYGMARATDLASYRNTPQDALATWSVLSMRWPVLARWLCDDPKRLTWRFEDQPLGNELGEEDSRLVGLMRSASLKRLLAHVGDMKSLEDYVAAASSESA